MKLLNRSGHKSKIAEKRYTTFDKETTIKVKPV